MNTRTIRYIGLGMAAMLIVAACGTSPTGRKQILLGSQDELDMRGAQAYEKIKTEEPLSTDPATVDFIACVAKAVVAELEGPGTDLDWELAVIDRPVVNAFVLPGGKIAVYTGMLDVAETDDQLAAVLGHEVAHVIAKHPLERTAGGQITSKVVSLGGAVIGGTALARQSSYTTLAILSQFGLMLPFTRKQETEADVIGVDYMARAGFDPRASVQLWKNMQENNKKEPPEFMSTHPSSASRIDHLVKQYRTALPLYNEAKANGLNPNCTPPPKREKPESEAPKEQ